MPSQKLLTVINEFAESKRARLNTCEGAYCECDRTTLAFISFAFGKVSDWMRMYDFDVDCPRNPDPTLYQRGQHPSANYHRAGWHCILELEDCFVDFTAKQYHQDACYPHILAKQVAGLTVGAAEFATQREYDDQQFVIRQLTLEGK